MGSLDKLSFCWVAARIEKNVINYALTIPIVTFLFGHNSYLIQTLKAIFNLSKNLIHTNKGKFILKPF